MKIDHVVRTHRGSRLRNEDAVLARPDKGLWAVADGMGGHQHGDVASALLMEALDTCAPDGDLHARADAAAAAIEAANRRLFEMGRVQSGRTIGSTIVALLTDPSAFVFLWAGDSRGYVVRGGELQQLTHDHSLVQNLVDTGQITPEEALTHPDGNVITRAAGASARLEVDRSEGQIGRADTFVLATDGLTRVMKDAEIGETIAASDLEAAADELIRTCLARGAPDNVSFVLLRFS
ncbi:MAG: serine/threonine-protein phosphatase [Caulobacteraceae bacterium]|nr:serine/threonine-protein phosphatase [Caulobacteraceae bacterium]